MSATPESDGMAEAPSRKRGCDGDGGCGDDDGDGDGDDGYAIERPLGANVLSVVSDAMRNETTRIAPVVRVRCGRGQTFDPYMTVRATLVLHTMGWAGPLYGIDRRLNGGRLWAWLDRYCRPGTEYIGGGLRGGLRPVLRDEVLGDAALFYEACSGNEMGVFFEPVSESVFFCLEIPRVTPVPLGGNGMQAHAFRLMVTMADDNLQRQVVLYNTLRGTTVHRYPFRAEWCGVPAIMQLHQSYLARLRIVRAPLLVHFYRDFAHNQRLRLLSAPIVGLDPPPTMPPPHRLPDTAEQWACVATTMHDVAALLDIDYGQLAPLDGALAAGMYRDDPYGMELSTAFADDPAHATARVLREYACSIIGYVPAIVMHESPEMQYAGMTNAALALATFVHASHSEMAHVSMDTGDERTRYVVDSLATYVEGSDPIPDELRCPLSRLLMRVPVLLCGDGYTYDALSLAQWLATPASRCRSTGAVVSPMTRQPLRCAGVVRNMAVFDRLYAACLARGQMCKNA